MAQRIRHSTHGSSVCVDDHSLSGYCKEWIFWHSCEKKTSSKKLIVMMEIIKRYRSRLWEPKADPIEAAKGMVSAVQMCVGIRDVFGDRDLKWSPFPLLAAVVFAGSFVYTAVFSQIMFLVQVFPDKLRTYQVVNCISSTCVSISNFIFMWTSRNRLRTIMKMSHDGLSLLPENTPARARMLQTLNRARGISWLVILNQGTIHIVFVVLPFMFTIFGNQRYLPNTPGESYGLSPKYETPFYETTFVIISLAAVFSGVNQTGFIVLFVTLVAHELGHFYAITETFNEIFKLLSTRKISEDSSSPASVNLSKKVDEKLFFCIRHHQFLIQYHEKIRELYENIFGVQYLVIIILLVTTLQTMNSWDFSTTMLTGGIGIMPLTIYCFGGELMISAADDTCQAVYSCGWELMGARQARAVGVVLGLSQRRLHLSAAGFATMNRDTFANVVQAVYKIYAVFH